MKEKHLVTSIVWIAILVSIATAQCRMEKPALASQVEAGSDEWITIRVAPAVRDETLRVLADGTVPERRLLRKGEDVTRYLVAKYGAANDKILGLFRRANSEIGSLSLERDTLVTFPAGPKWKSTPVVVTIPPGSDWRAEVTGEFGYTNSRLRETAVAQNPSLAGEITLRGGRTTGLTTKVTLPYTTGYATFRLSGKTQEERTALIAELRKDTSVLSLEAIAATKLYPHWIPELAPVDSSTLLSSNAICPEQPAITGWSIAALRIQEIQDRDIDAIGAGDRVTVAVFDSGVVMETDDAVVPDKRFHYWRHTPLANDNDYICHDCDFGCDMIGGAIPIDDMASAQDPEHFRNHGTHVAGIATGAMLTGPLKSVTDKRLQLMVIKIADNDGYVDPIALTSAIPYAIQNGANVVNLSFDIPKLSAMSALIKDEGQHVLFVAAAGNGRDGAGVDVTTEQQRYLNVLHQELPNNFITVAAEDPSGNLACFSNFSPTQVDLAAPGFGIESTVGGNQTLELSGTSQAAPFVTFAAALLRSLGLKEPEDIKNRLIISTDFNMALKSKVLSAGTLNIAKAVSLNSDVIEVLENDSLTNKPTRKILFGRLLSPTLVQIPGVPTSLITKSDIRKITFHYDDANPKISRVYYMGTDVSTGRRTMAPYVGKFDVESVEFQVNGESESRIFTPAQILDVVMASP